MAHALKLKGHYTGIGSRDTPLHICKLIEAGARVFADKGWILRSGHARGADKAFYDGHKSSSFEPFPMCEIYIPFVGFSGIEHGDDDFIMAYELEKWEEAKKIAESVIPWWHNVKGYHQNLHTRNVFQVLGWDLQTPSKKVIYWGIPDKKLIVKGGTGTAARLAHKYNVPYDNLYYEEPQQRLKQLIEANPPYDFVKEINQLTLRQ